MHALVISMCNGAADVAVLRTVVLGVLQDTLLQPAFGRVRAAISSVIGMFVGVIGLTLVGLSHTFARCFGVGYYFLELYLQIYIYI